MKPCKTNQCTDIFNFLFNCNLTKCVSTGQQVTIIGVTAKTGVGEVKVLVTATIIMVSTASKKAKPIYSLTNHEESGYGFTPRNYCKNILQE